MEEKKNLEQEKEERSGEELLREYYGQDKDDKHYMGYDVYGVTHNDGCCC
jgi:hypothetical protein